MVTINEGDRAGICNVNGGGDHHQHQQQEAAYDQDFPPGYRFQPTDEELIKEYLYRKVKTLRLPQNHIVDVNIYSCNPWELTDRYPSYGERIHYYFTPREKKYPNGSRPNRAAGVGYWKACGADKPIYDKFTNKKIGSKRVLVFYRGKSPKGDKTEWIMHEYTLEKPKQKKKEENKNESSSSSTSTGSSRKNKGPCSYSGNPKDKQLDEFVLCKLYLKVGKSTKDTENTNHDSCEDMNEENDIVVDHASPNPIANAISSEAAAAVPENHHDYMHQTAVDHQYYPSTSMVVAAASAEEMVPVNHHQHQHDMHQTNVTNPAAIDHQYPLTSMVPAVTREEMILCFDYDFSYLDNINPFSSSSSAILPSVNHQYNGAYHPAAAASSAILPSVPAVSAASSASTILPSVTQQQSDEDIDIKWNRYFTDCNHDTQSNFLAGLSLPHLRTDISPK